MLAIRSLIPFGKSNFTRATLQRPAFIAACAVFVGLAATTGSQAASSFADGVTIRTGITTLTAPPDLAAAAALLGPSSNRTLTSAGLGFDFASGNNSFDLSGNTLRGSCLVAATFCGSFTTPSPPNFLGLIISDTATPGGELDPIVGVTSSLLTPAQIFFDANTIVIDISGLGLAPYPSYTNLIEVEFGTATTVPVPAALPMFISGLGMLGLAGRLRKRKASAKA